MKECCKKNIPKTASARFTCQECGDRHRLVNRALNYWTPTDETREKNGVPQKDQYRKHASSVWDRPSAVIESQATLDFDPKNSNELIIKPDMSDVIKKRATMRAETGRLPEKLILRIVEDKEKDSLKLFNMDIVIIKGGD